MADIFGQIDLTELGKVVKANPACVKQYTDKGGVTHKLVNIVIKDLRPEKKTQYKTDYIKVYVKKENEVQGVNYFIGDANDKHGNANAQQSVVQTPVVPSSPQPVSMPEQTELPQSPAAPAQEEELPF